MKKVSKVIANVTVFDPYNIWDTFKLAKGFLTLTFDGHVNKVWFTKPTNILQCNIFEPIDKGECGCYVFNKSGNIIAGIIYEDGTHNNGVINYSNLGVVYGQHIFIFPATECYS